MSVYAEVVAWSDGLPLWQRDALRRLATHTDLHSPDIEQLVALCVAESTGQTASPAPVSMDETHVPSVRGAGSSVALVGLSASKSINAIADGQSLTFGARGLTIIYGDNGTGKSGYARVLRNACQARGAIDAVLPNVYAAQTESPGARVDYLAGGESRSFVWAQGGTASPDELRAVAIFDSHAAAALVERENEILWTPAGLDLLVRLVTVVGEVRAKLQSALSAVAVPGPLPQLPRGTRAAAFLEGLSATTQPMELDAFPLKTEEQAELKRLDAALTAPDPATTAAQVRQRAQRFRALRQRVGRLEQALGEAALGDLSKLRAAHQAAVDAEALLARTTFEGSPVPDVGGAPWQALWQAAESYARSGATPDRRFPSADQPGLCLLCQRPLDDAARARLERFHTFVRADVAQRRTAAAQALQRKINEIQSLRVRESADSALIEELTALHAGNGAGLSRFLDAASSAAATISALAPGAADSPLPSPLPTGWASWLDSVVTETERQAASMLSAAAPDQRAATEARRQELVARQALAVGRALVEAEMRRLARQAALEKAIASCTTTGITRKAGELTRVYVSDRLMEAFAAEGKALRLPVTVKYCHSRNEKGTSYQRVILEAAPWAARTGEPVRILSEGERRAVALAAFLAELATRADRSGVVLDDPVSSLDHERRRVVASRLADLASERQVVVFTHELVFLHMLKTAADQRGVTIMEREVRRTTAGSGLCRDKPPVKAMRVKALIGELKERHQSCAAAHRAGRSDDYETQLTNTFGLLREGWERAVEELLLNQSVMRFDHRVQTQRLKNLHDITESDLAEIDAGMTVCSKWLPGHALAPAINEPLPDPSALLAEIQRLERFTQEMRKRGRS